MAERRRFLAALLVEGRAAIEIDGLRRALGSKELERIVPHITLAPPKNVADVESGAVFDHLNAAGALCGALHLVLGPPKSFLKANGVVFLSVSGDVGTLDVLHSHLAHGPMGIVDGHPRRPFVPHVTLASRLHDEVVASALASLSKYRVNTVIERLSLLEQRYEDATRRWDVVGAIEFGGIALRGRGGRELTFQVASQLDPNDAEWVKDAWEAYRKFTYGKDVSPDQSYAITARHQGSIVGCATGVLRGQICELGVLIVDAAHRNEGIGAQLLKEVEYLARVKGASRMLLRTLCAGSAVGFYEARGYRRVAILPTWREGRDFAVLERIL